MQNTLDGSVGQSALPLVDATTGNVVSGEVTTRGILLFVHGFMDAPESIAAVSQALDLSDWTMLAVDLRALQQKAPGAGTALQGFADATVAALQSCGLTDGHDFVVIGHSMGGQVAELVAARLGDALKGLVLICPAPLQGYPLTAEQQDMFRQRAMTRDPEAIKAGRGRLAPNASGDSMQTLVKTAMETEVDTALFQLDAWTTGDPAGREPSQVNLPVRLVCSDDIFFTPDFLSEHVTPRFSNIQTTHIAEAGHWPHVERPAQVANVVKTFTKRLT
ncbi:alpha/beta fold hydrolase [Ruegeria jejuensis]|uniref:alpha/beta fold hydrolase n=1 Tax=Ruegeria jejuensis TaxID=3233338 RepID=UPI00355C5F10